MSGLTVAAESLAEHVVLAELDDDVAAVWQTIFAGRDADVRWLCNRITGFDVTLENVRKVLDGKPSSTKEWAWRTIIKNRMQRGGIMSAGAGLVKEGEAGRGLKSRWYPETLATRIEVLRSMRERVTFEHADAFAVIQAFADDTNAFSLWTRPILPAARRRANAYTPTTKSIMKACSLSWPLFVVP
jgi:hypothetical protein